jgi:hypothetical protein
MNDRAPVRRALKHILARLELGSFPFRYRIEALERMHYAYILYQAAKLASRLGQRRISAIEFGVAGGNGLVWLERHAEAIERLFPVHFEIYGFDTGGGLPQPKDYRDLPYHWQAGFFSMERDRLEKKLKRAHLVIGDVAETWKTFVDTYSPAPVAAVAHDLDFYSSTAEGLKLFEFPDSHLMPRIFCYFDDTIGGDVELYSDFTGERLAIHEFNASHENRKIAIPYHLRCQEGLGTWRHQIWVCHLFDHAHYNDFIGDPNQQLPLGSS